MIVQRGKLIKPGCVFALLVLPLLWLTTVVHSAVVTVEHIQCAYDPNSGQPNPFGSRAFITVSQMGADTTFRFERFPSLVQLASKGDTEKVRAVTVENQRTMVFYNTEIEVARELMRINNSYYYELIGYVDAAGYSSYDEAMSCG